MAERNGAAMRIDVIGVVGDAKLPQTGQALRGKSLVELDQVEIGNLQTEPGHQLARRRHRADAHDARRDAGGGHAENTRARLQAVRFHASVAGQNDGG
jgi:hypothetical protein